MSPKLGWVVALLVLGGAAMVGVGMAGIRVARRVEEGSAATRVRGLFLAVAGGVAMLTGLVGLVDAWWRR